MTDQFTYKGVGISLYLEARDGSWTGRAQVKAPRAAHPTVYGFANKEAAQEELLALARLEVDQLQDLV